VKISSDWVVYYLRSFNLCEGVHNRKIGIAVSKVLEEMNCPQDPKGKQIFAPSKISETDLADRGLQYVVKPEDLAEFFKKLAEELDFELA
jgi:hypothetical protein